MLNNEQLREDLERIQNNVSDPEWVAAKLRQRSLAKISQLVFGTDGVNVASQDWDNLIILDGCRADLFESSFDTTAFDRYDRVRSKGSLTSEWVKKNFTDRDLGDVVYVSGNPFVSLHARDSFYQLEEVWKDDFNEEAGTVLPETLTKRALDAYDENKRLIIHFMQPHWPFYSTNIGRQPGTSMDLIGKDEGDDSTYHNPFQALRHGHYKKEEVWSAYKENLGNVQNHVKQLTDELDGKTVVTSDHGNLFGERIHRFVPIRLYGHPTRGLRVPELVDVPWAVVDGRRRDIQQGEVSPVSTSDDDVVANRLSHLGYKE